MISRLFRQMLITQVVSAMTVTLCMLIDSIMIGRFLGVDSMSAYGLASPLLLVFAAMGSMIAAGVQVVCGRAVGSGDRSATDACFSASVSLAAGISAVGLILVFIFMGPLTTLLGAGEAAEGNDVYFLTKDYLTGFIIGAPAFLCAQIMVPYMQFSGSRVRLVAAVAAMTASDIALDLLNVFVFKGGTLGMGLASTASYYIAFFIGIGYFFKKNCLFRFRLRLVTAKVCHALIASGIPTVINQVSLVLLVFLLNHLLLTTGGNTAVAAYSVISTVGNLCYCFGSGTAAVAMMLASIFHTEEDRTSMNELIRVMTRWAVILNLAVTVIVLAGAPLLVGLFLGGGTSAGALAENGLRLFVLSMIPCALNTTYKNYFQGIGRVRLTELISVLQNFLLPALFAFVLSRFAGTTGVWLCFVCGESAALIVWAAIVWRHNRGISFSADAFSMLPADFGAAEEDCFEGTLQSLDDAVNVSRSAVEFCQAHGMPRRESMLFGLCIEEMTINIVRHGFTKQQDRPHNIDVRLVAEGERRVLRIRDNCVNFDPIHYLELHQSEDPTAHVGIRMVMGMVKEANYVNTLGLNNLTLTM